MPSKMTLDIRENWSKGDAIRDEGLTTPDDIKRFDDIQYGPDEKFNKLDVYCPTNTDKPLPVIVSIHGGGWVYGDKEVYQHYCMRLAQRGFTVVNFTYRLAPESRYPAQLKDIMAVFFWIKENDSQYFMDLNNIFMVGDSAGGQLAHQVCVMFTNPKYRSLFSFPIPDVKINAVALNCGCYFFPVSRLIKPAAMIEEYLPKDYIPVLPQLKVMKNTSKDFPPAFVMSAHCDYLKFMAKPMYNRLQRLGVESELHIYGSPDRKDISHVFHVNCKLAEADKCNDEECEFFRKHIV